MLLRLKKKHFFGAAFSALVSMLFAAGLAYAALTFNQNIQVGGGTAGLTLDGDDVYVTGTFEVDGIANLGGVVTLPGAGDGTDALILTLGDILISNGDFTMSGGDFDATLDAGDSAGGAGGRLATAAGGRIRELPR